MESVVVPQAFVDVAMYQVSVSGETLIPAVFSEVDQLIVPLVVANSEVDSPTQTVSIPDNTNVGKESTVIVTSAESIHGPITPNTSIVVSELITIVSLALVPPNDQVYDVAPLAETFTEDPIHALDGAVKLILTGGVPPTLIGPAVAVHPTPSVITNV